MNENVRRLVLLGRYQIGEIGFPKTRILRRQKDSALENAVANGLKPGLGPIHRHKHDLILLAAALDDRGGGDGQTVAVPVDEVEIGIGGHPVLGDRHSLGRIPVGRLLGHDLDTWILGHHVGEAARAVGIEALAEQAL